MATGSSTIAPRKPASAGKLAEYDRFIDKQLRHTRAQVRTVDAASGLLMLTTGTLAYFFVMALLDHWALAGGLPSWARLVALIAYGVVAGWYLLTRLLPLLLRRINPLYAAETIERTQPSLKNALLNFLMFRARPQGLPESVYHAVEEQAAAKLARVPIETVVDRSKLINLGYALIGVLAVCALYKIFSPKDPLTSVGRVVMPWADILPPTRVTIDDIRPGSAKAFRGQKLTVSAEVRGLEQDGKVTLVYTTADGQTVDRAVEMHVPKDGYRHTCSLPPDEDGVQQTLRYRIVAGDARSHEHTITVAAAPTIVVDSVEYEYPAYTGLLTQTIDHQGDIKAIEGTRVIVHAVTNQPIKTAGLDFECDEHEDLPLTVDGTGDSSRGATVSFALELERDRKTPTHTSYQLRFENSDGDRNQEPIRHTIDVVPDLPPEVEFLAPKKPEVLVREGDVLPIELTASDPDFALKQVRLIAEVSGQRLFEKSLLKGDRRGQFNHKFRLSTREHKLKAGDVVEYWAVAQDIKTPKPNEVESIHRIVRIVPRDTKAQPNQGGEGQPPLEGEQENPKQAEEEQQGDRPSEGKPEQGENKQDGQGEKGKQDDGQKSENQAEDADGGGQQGDPQAGDNGDGNQQGDDKADQKGDGQEPGKNKNRQGDQKGDDKQGGEDQAGNGQDGGQDDPNGQQDGKQQGGKEDGKPQQGGAGDQKQGQPKETVPNDGTDDGTAFDKALKHLQEKENQEGAQQDQGDGQIKNENPGSKKPQGQNKQAAGQNKGGEEKPTDNKPQPGEKQDDNSGDQGGDKTQGEEQPGQSGSKKAEKKPAESGGPQGHEQKGDASDDAKAGENSQAGEQTEGVSKDAKKQQGDPKQGGQAQKVGEKQPEAGQEKSDQPSQDKPGQAAEKDGQAQSGNPRDQRGEKKSEQQGQGDAAKGDDPTGAKKPSVGQQSEAKGGSTEQEKGQSGKGQKSDDNQGSPEAQGDNQQSKKSQKPSSQQEGKGKSEAQSPSNSSKQSDSEGDSDGDKSGGGGKGGGQKAKQPGTGGAGENTPSDEGANKSNEQGEGQTGDKAGDQQESDSPTGKSGDQAGQGSQSKPGEKSDGGKPGQQPEGNGPQSQDQSSQPGAAGNGGNQASGGGGKPDQPGNPAQTAKLPEPGADKANLEYARKATDLVLEKLRDQLDKGKPDQELLDELGWTREDLEKFLHRWEQMRDQAREESSKGEEAKRELDATLRSLGLRPRGTTLSGNRGADDSQRGLKESRRTRPPAEYAEQYKAYTQGTARGGK